MTLKELYNKAIKAQWVTGDLDTQYSITINRNTRTIELKFQGTVSRLDRAYNFLYFKKPYKHMDTLFFVHAGIFKKYRAVQKDIYEKINNFMVDGYKLRIYGFSQGGTLTSFAFEDARFRFPDNDIKGWAFAPARGFTIFGRKVLAKRMKGLTVIINRSDIVPKVPLRIQLFRHYGKIIKIGKWKLTPPWKWEYEHMRYKELLIDK